MVKMPISTIAKRDEGFSAQQEVDITELSLLNEFEQLKGGSKFKFKKDGF